jgi:hypothetical protein
MAHDNIDGNFMAPNCLHIVTEKTDKIFEIRMVKQEWYSQAPQTSQVDMI